MNINFTYLPGDGIGPEVGAASIAVLEAVSYTHLTLPTTPYV